MHLLYVDESGVTTDASQRYFVLAGVSVFERTTHWIEKSLDEIAEVPVFLDSRASRLIQLADLVAFAIFRHFEHGDSKYWDVIKDSFDSEGGVKHGFLLCDHAHLVLERTLRGRSRLA